MPPVIDTLYHPADVADIDQQAMALMNINGDALMARAAESIWCLIRQRWPQHTTLTVLVGPGNNGGDGLVVARLAHQAGYTVQLVSAWSAERFDQLDEGEAANAWHAWRSQGGGSPESTLPEQPGLLVDALFGAGLNRPLEGDWLTLVKQCRACDAPVLAVDSPSGLDGASGALLPVALEATATLCVVAPKLGLFTGRGPDACGELYFDSLDCPPQAADNVPGAGQLLTPATLPALPQRRAGAHKGEAGQALVVGGSPGMPGAIALTAEGCARSGAGLTRVWTADEHASILATRLPEAIWQGVTAPWPALPDAVRAIGMGPGLGRSAFGRQLFQHVVGRSAGSERTLVLDADALYWLSRSPRQDVTMVITPHPGEAAMLLGTDTASIEADRPSAVRELAQRFNAIAILKGAGSLISDGQRLAVCQHGNPGMASAGMGDTLCGIVTGLIAQGLSAWDAARWGVLLHAASGDLAADGQPIGLLASDLMAPLRILRNGGTLPGARLRAWRGGRS